MDKPRIGYARQLRIRRILIGAALFLAVAAITWALSRLEPAAPSVDGATVFQDTVKRGSMLRQVRGIGILAPETIVFVPANDEGRVERRLVVQGQAVTPDTILLELSSPRLEQESLDAQAQLAAAVADLANLRAQLESQRLDQESASALIEGEYKQAKAQFDADLEQSKFGLISAVELTKSRVTMEQLKTRLDLERDRVPIREPSVRAQLAAQQARIDQLQTLVDLRLDKIEKLRVRAGVAGVLQLLEVEVGQLVTPGAVLARVSDPKRLKAELRIPETQVRDVAIGQSAEIDTRNGLIPGRVSRIDPAAIQGTVTVDVELLGELPRGARPDLSVDGRIELERLEDVLHVGRPIYGQAESTIGLFKMEQDGIHASRVQVQVGRTSVNTIEVRAGLAEGDQVILSDMSAWDAYDRIRLD